MLEAILVSTIVGAAGLWLLWRLLRRLGLRKRRKSTPKTSRPQQVTLGGKRVR